MIQDQFKTEGVLPGARYINPATLHNSSAHFAHFVMMMIICYDFVIFLFFYHL